MLEGYPAGTMQSGESSILHDGNFAYVTYDGGSGGINSRVKALDRYIKDHVNVPLHSFVSRPNDSRNRFSSPPRQRKNTDISQSDYGDEPLREDSQYKWSSTGETADASADDPFVELRSATQRNTYSYGQFEEFDIGSPPSARSTASCPNCNFYTQSDDPVLLDADISKHQRRQGSFNRHLKHAKHCVRVLARKPLDVAARFTRYCKKHLN